MSKKRTLGSHLHEPRAPRTRQAHVDERAKSAQQHAQVPAQVPEHPWLRPLPQQQALPSTTQQEPTQQPPPAPPGRPPLPPPPLRRTLVRKHTQTFWDGTTREHSELTRRIRHESDTSKIISMHTPAHLVRFYADVAPIRHALVLALDALITPLAPSTYVPTPTLDEDGNAEHAYKALARLARASQSYISAEDANELTKYAELWIGGFRDSRYDDNRWGHESTWKDREGRTSNTRPIKSNSECLRWYLGAPHSRNRRPTPAHLVDLDPRTRGQKDHFLYRTFKKAVYENKLREWHFNTSWAHPTYGMGRYLIAVVREAMTPEQNAYVEEHVFKVERERKAVEDAIGANQAALSAAHNRELPHRKRVLTPPARLDPATGEKAWTRVNTSLPAFELDQLRERAFCTTSDTLSRFCSYVWLWAHSKDYKVPHVIACKLYAFAAGGYTEWEEVLERYRASYAFQSAPHAHVNPLGQVAQVLGPTPGLADPAAQLSWCQDVRGTLDLTRRSNLARGSQPGIAAYLDSLKQ